MTLANFIAFLIGMCIGKLIISLMKYLWRELKEWLTD